MEEDGYLNVMRKVLDMGEVKTGRNGKTYSLFGERLEFDLTTGFPLLTTKKVFVRGVVEELLWFLRGSTDATELQEKHVHIWDDNTTREFLDSVGLYDVPTGHLGAGYGFQWREFGGVYPSGEGGVDQVKYVLNELMTNPNGRRTILCAWNPKQLMQACLPPCHVYYNFNVGACGLSCMMVQRSADFAAGVPFNIASTALFTTILAHVLHIPAHRVIINLGDTHLYEEHLDGARTQVTREPYPKPSLQIVRIPPPKDSSLEEKMQWIETLKYEDFQVNEYTCHPPIKYKMIA